MPGMRGLVVALLAVPFGLAFAQPARPLHEQIGIELTGKNAYEDYLLAGDALRASPLPELIEGPILMQHRRRLERGKTALSLIARARYKSCWQPRGTANFATLFPEYAEFRNLGRLLGSKIAVDFAEGRPDEAVVAFTDAMLLAEGLNDGPLIAYLVGAAIESIALGELQNGAHQLTPRGCRTLRAWARERMGDRGLAQAMTIEYQLMALSLHEMVQKREILQSVALPEGFQSRSALDYEGLGREIDAILVAHRAELESIVRGPTSGLVHAKLPTLDPTSVAGAIVESFSPVFENVTQVEARRRGLVRQVALVTRVTEYRWATGRLPMLLSDAAPADECLDPISEKPFEYIRTGPSTFEIWSVGGGNLPRFTLGNRARYEQPLEPQP